MLSENKMDIENQNYDIYKTITNFEVLKYLIKGLENKINFNEKRKVEMEEIENENENDDENESCSLTKTKRKSFTRNKTSKYVYCKYCLTKKRRTPYICDSCAIPICPNHSCCIYKCFHCFYKKDIMEIEE